MEDNRMVFHDGEVIESRDNSVRVKIISRSACSQCHAKGMCSAADMEEKIIDAVSSDPLYKGDAVTVIMEEKLGRLAIFYGFFLPFIVMVSVLFTARGLGGSEPGAALLGVGSLLPYYLVLYTLRKKIEKDFIFKAEKRANNKEMR